ncbi:MAG: tRNA (guanosine(46)-N7)-methyltransferase TrmB [Gammaproteobacteria bacterium]|nr:tRNA (guanosine(46)-N7)-methyltransferase TrmB [Gammaproteobacteria bacterium]
MSGAQRLIRSYVRRERPFKESQKADWERLWPRYGVPRAAWGSVVAAAPVILDIGFGDGEALMGIAAADSAHTYMGVEMYRSGLLKVMRGAEHAHLPNVRVVEADANEVLAALPADSLAGAHVFFPDPWPKARHHKRRLVTAAFIAALVRVLRPGGIIHMATDWENYAAEAAQLFRTFAVLEPLAPERNGRPETRFERRGWRLGHSSYDLRYRRLP